MRLHIFENKASSHGNVALFGRELARALSAEGQDVVLSPVGGRDYEDTVIAALSDPAADAIITFTGNGTDPNPDPAANAFNRCRARLVDLYLDPMALYIDSLVVPIGRRLMTTTSPDGLVGLSSLIKAGQSLRLLPHAADPVEPLPWAERDIPVLLVGNNSIVPAAVLRQWRAFPPNAMPILEAGAQAIIAGRHSLCDVVRETLTQAGRPASLADFRSYALEIDRMVRAQTRAVAGPALATLPLTIVGEGWGWLKGLGEPTILGPLPAEDVAQLTRRAKILVNLVTPYHGSHERLFRAMAAGVMPLSTPSVWLADNFPGDVLAMASPDRLGEVAAALLADPDLEARAMRGREMLLAGHTWRHRARTLAGWLSET